MDGQWLTYGEAAARLGVSIDAIRRRAARGHWARMAGNDGRARIRLPDDLPIRRLDAAQDDTPTLVRVLEDHVATLKADIARLTAELADERERAGEAEARLREETARADQAVAELAGEKAARRAGEKLSDMRLAERDEQLAAARAAADRATAELVTLAQRLAAIAEAQQAPDVAPEPRRSRAGRAWRWFLRN
jgi:hypothetical protein